MRTLVSSIIVILAFLMLGWMYSQATPLLETPDEPSHFEVVSYIAANKRLPPLPKQFRTGIAPTVSTDVPYYYAPPLYYALSSWLVGDIDAERFAEIVVPNPNFARGLHISLGDDLTSKNMYVHVADQRVPYADWAVAFRRVRLFSLFLSAITVAGSIVLARLLWPMPIYWCWRWVAVLLVAFNPTFLYLSGGVSNDSLLVAISTWSIVLMVHMLIGGGVDEVEKTAVFGWRELSLALLLGAAALTKQSGLILYPLAGLTFLLAARQQRWPWQRLAKTLLIVGMISGVIGGWWYIQNWVRYDDPLALSVHASLPLITSVGSRFLFLLEQSWGAFKSYWAAFGWATIFVHPAWYAFFALLTLGGVSGWLLPRSLRGKSPWSQELLLLLWGATVLNSVAMIRWLWTTAAPYGRLLFMIIAPLACLLVEGWRRWFVAFSSKKPWIEFVWQTAVCTTLITLALIVPTRYLHPTFDAPIASAAELEQATPVQVRFDDRYQLIGYTFTPQRPKPGEIIELTLYWQLTDDVDDPIDLDTFVQLAPQNPERWIASIDTLLGAPRYPTSIWRTDETILQQFSLPVPQDAAAPALYWFNIGVYNGQTDNQFSITLSDQPIQEKMVRLGPLPITPDLQTAPISQIEVQYEFDNSIKLQGVDVVSSGNNEVQVTLYWQALVSPLKDWTVFVHLLDKEGQLIAQHDAKPVNGNFPTNWWQEGNGVMDTHTLKLKLAEAGDLSDLVLRIGLYNPLDGSRSPVINEQQMLLPEGAILIKIP